MGPLHVQKPQIAGGFSLLLFFLLLSPEFFVLTQRLPAYRESENRRTTLNGDMCRPFGALSSADPNPGLTPGAILFAPLRGSFLRRPRPQAHSGGYSLCLNFGAPILFLSQYLQILNSTELIPMRPTCRVTTSIAEAACAICRHSASAASGSTGSSPSSRTILPSRVRTGWRRSGYSRG
jgi:hypothetical protein